MTSGARETGKATVRDSASAAGEWPNTEHKSAAETPNPNALFPADSIHPSLSPHFVFSFFSSHVHVGNHNLRGNKTSQVGFPSFNGILALTSKFWQRFFIFLFLKFVCWNGYVRKKVLVVTVKLCSMWFVKTWVWDPLESFWVVAVLCW